MIRRPILRFLVPICGAAALIGCADTQAVQDTSVTKPTLMNDNLKFVQLSLGDFHSCGLLEDGEAFCWGLNTQGQSGNGTPSGAGVNTPLPVQGGFRFSSLSAGGSSTCGILLTGGQTYCWGNNFGGQLGDGSTLTRGEPGPINGDHLFVQISNGTLAHVCGLKANGEAWCWGDNTYGQLGNGSRQQKNVPTLVSGGVTFTSISAGGGHTCGIAADSSAYCWGLNSRGQLGDGTTTDRLEPTRVATTQRFIRISAGLEHTCALNEVGDPYCWGSNVFGSLGDGTFESKSVPTTLEHSPNFAMIVSGERHSCGLDASGVVLCWGHNLEGQLGDGTKVTRSTPALLVSAIAFKSIAAGAYFTCGISQTDLTYCWGNNYGFQLGIPEEP